MIPDIDLRSRLPTIPRPIYLDSPSMLLLAIGLLFMMTSTLFAIGAVIALFIVSLLAADLTMIAVSIGAMFVLGLALVLGVGLTIDDDDTPTRRYR